MTVIDRRRWGLAGRAVMAVVSAVVIAATVVVPAAVAAAQTSTSLPAGPPTEPDPLNAGGIVFLVVSAVLFGGALLLYLRHRPRVHS